MSASLKPFGSQVLRKFKRFDGDVDDFVPASVASLDFESEMCGSITEFGILLGKGLGVDLFQQQMGQQSFLLLAD